MSRNVKGRGRPQNATCVHPDGRRKHSFRSRAQARKHAQKTPGRLYPYRCDRCGLWHISSSPPRTEVVFGNDNRVYVDSRSYERVLREIEQAKAEGYDAIRWRDHRVPIDLDSITAVIPPNDREAA